MGLRVDGVEHDPGPVPAATPLIFVLERKLGVRGTRKRCRRHNCGGCKVLLDGEPVKACEIRWEDAEGREVRTLGGDAGQSAS